MLARRATKGGLGPGYLHLLLDLDYLGPDVAIYTYFWKTKKKPALHENTAGPAPSPPSHQDLPFSPSSAALCPRVAAQ